MKKSIFSRILVIAAGAVLLAFAITVRHAKAEWQHSEAYGYDIWCDMGRFCSGTVAGVALTDLGYLLIHDPYWLAEWENYVYDGNPFEVYYGICEWLPPLGLQYGIPCGCQTMNLQLGPYFFAVLNSSTPCGFAVPMS